MGAGERVMAGMDHQALRNALSKIEDQARALRNRTPSGPAEHLAYLVTRLTQIVREEIVK